MREYQISVVGPCRFARLTLKPLPLYFIIKYMIMIKPWLYTFWFKGHRFKSNDNVFSNIFVPSLLVFVLSFSTYFALSYQRFGPVGVSFLVHKWHKKLGHFEVSITSKYIIPRYIIPFLHDSIYVLSTIYPMYFQEVHNSTHGLGVGHRVQTRNLPDAVNVKESVQGGHSCLRHLICWCLEAQKSRQIQIYTRTCQSSVLARSN